jgi:3-phenylpropionate/cinnamic acid dioxygenase small subunit
MKQTDLLLAISLLNAQYADAIDADRLEEWPEFFTDDCLYSVTSHSNHVQGLETGIIYCDSKGMLKDRVSGLREANIYEGHRYRHLIMMPTRAEMRDGVVRAETPFAVYRIMRDGRTDLFVTGCYVDDLRFTGDETLKLAQRIVVCDSFVFNTLLAIPL